jgi:hypothetical protein
MISVGCALDAHIWPTQHVDYPNLIRIVLGDQVEDKYRLMWCDNAGHVPPQWDVAMAAMSGDPEPRRVLTRRVSYAPLVRQLLRDLVEWVEDGKAPPPGTAYRLDENNALVLPKSAQERGGYQPVVRLSANGGPRAEVKVREVVELTGEAEVASVGGPIVSAEWDLDGTGNFAHAAAVDGESKTLRTTLRHSYAEPGTCFVTLRVASHPKGRDGSEPIPNIARARVVVT